MNEEEQRRFYRETIQSFGEGEETYIRQKGGRGHYAHVRVAVQPIEIASGVQVTWEAGVSIPAGFAAAVVGGIYDVLRAGVLAGAELNGVHASVVDGSYHDVDSTAEAFREAAMGATAQALRKSKPVLLEALAHFKVRVPNGLREIVEELVRSFGGRVKRSYAEDHGTVVEADLRAPVGFDFLVKVVEAGEGQSKVSMSFAGYEIKPEPPDTMKPWVRSSP
jgi:elongation factor G